MRAVATAVLWERLSAAMQKEYCGISPSRYGNYTDHPAATAEDGSTRV